jgi:hypothetical protein
MAYLGNTPTTQGFIPAIDFFSGNGATVAFTLSRPVASVAQVQATIENVPQNPGTAFTVSGNTITFDGAPPSGTNNIYVYYTSPITQVIAPSQGTVFPSTLSTGGPYWDTSGNVGIGTTSPTVASGLGLVLNGSSGQTRLAFKNSYTGDTSTDGVQFALENGSSSFLFQNREADGTFYWAINGTEQARITTAGLMQFNSGYGSSATAYGCRAWVNFNGQGTVSIRASGNVSSISDNGTGNYVVNFTTAMPNTNYAVPASFQRIDETGQFMNIGFGNGTGGFNVETFRAGSNTNTAVLADFATVSLAVFR